MEDPKLKCKHLPCSCEVSAGEPFCSEVCRTADLQPPEAKAHCTCGHAGCSAETISLETAEALGLATAVIGTA
jgi:hypothetical protein